MLHIFQCVYYLQRDYTFWLLTLHEDADFRFIICFIILDHFIIFYILIHQIKGNELNTEDALHQMFRYLLDNKIHHAFVAFGYSPYSHPA